ncbi:MAG TPA: cardiolipin synthase ClsB [Quisquiliibacterium sp.]|nr:cardiolipin synthase ClsB [Quisquiliibacterium sp.]
MRRLAARAWYESLRPVRQGGHEVILLEGGREFFPALLEAIEAAQAQIALETYIFADDPSARSVARALAAAARRGVQARVVVDGFGTPKLGAEIAAILAGGGVAVETFGPGRGRFALDRQRLRRLHRKLAVIDGRVVFVGGINILDDRYDPNHGALDAPRFDFAVRVRGPLAASAQLAVQRLWWELAIVNRPSRLMRRRAREELELSGEVISDVTPAGTMTAMLVLRDNFRFRREIENEYLRAIGRARREVLIANAYFFPGRRLRLALIAAAASGVRVRLLLQGRVEYRLQHWASQAMYDELLRAGIEIVEYRPSFLHAKVAVIDDWATVGSSNIDPFSLLLAREANVVIEDAGFAAQLRARIGSAIDEGGAPVALTRHAHRAWPIRAVQTFSYLLLRLGVAISGAGADY